MPTNPSPHARYLAALAQGFKADPAQQPIVMALETCYQALHQPTITASAVSGPTKGVYIWGPVGRGKTWLMDQFHHSLRVPALRMHFHHFMRYLHQRLFQISGTPEPLRVIAEQLASQYRVLCFDELFVSDIADAILLGRVFQYLFEQRVVLVTTSNQPPQSLYADGFNREQFLPAISALLAHTNILQLDGAQDHRLHPREQQQRYWLSDINTTSPLSTLFTQLSGDMPQAYELPLAGRTLHMHGAAQRIIWCDFSELCQQPFSALDYVNLCDQAHAILLSNVPCLSAPQRTAKIARGTEDSASRVIAGDRQLQTLSIHDDSVRRFIALVDECYDRRIALYLEAAVNLDHLYSEGALLFAFQRTLSRLQAMQYSDYQQHQK